MSTSPIKILADGTHCAPGDSRTDHVAVLLPEHGLMIHPVSLGTSKGAPLRNWSACDAAARDLRVLGYDDWHLASRRDWLLIIDDTRFAPAVDTSVYPGILPRWHWTSTDCAWEEKNAAGRSASAWGVGASGGGVNGHRRDGVGFALAVRRVGQ